MKDFIPVRIEDWDEGISLAEWWARYELQLDEDTEYDLSAKRVAWNDWSPEQSKIHDQTRTIAITKRKEDDERNDDV